MKNKVLQKWVYPLLLLTFFSFPLIAQNQTVIDSSEVKSIDRLIKALYDVISGPAGQKRNWDRMRFLFKPQARLIATGKDSQGNIRYNSMLLEDYITKNGASLEKNGFFEIEIGRKTEQFGLVTHIFSTYQTKFQADGKVMMRGINSIQIIFDGSRYWIENILWNNETSEFPIPAKYLEK